MYLFNVCFFEKKAGNELVDALTGCEYLWQREREREREREKKLCPQKNEEM